MSYNFITKSPWLLVVGGCDLKAHLEALLRDVSQPFFFSFPYVGPQGKVGRSWLIPLSQCWFATSGASQVESEAGPMLGRQRETVRKRQAGRWQVS